MLRVIYVVGCGHSGSTVLDALLGSHPQSVGVGELSRFSNPTWTAEQYCSCGSPVRECGFWSEVRSRFVGADDVHRLSLLRRSQRRVERIRHLPWTMRANFTESLEFKTYAELTRSLYSSIAEASACSTIVDSSKSPSRALVLSRVPGLDVRLIHLVRDGRGVGCSYAKPVRREPPVGIARNRSRAPLWRTSLEWRAVNLLSEHVTRQAPARSCRVRYEDFVGEPEVAFRRLGEALSTDLAPAVAASRASEGLDFGHRLAGNPVRMSRGVSLSLDRRWMTDLSARDRMIFWALAGGMAKRYGYERRPSDT